MRSTWFLSKNKGFCYICADTAYSCDPRIKKFKEEEKARKESEKKAKAEAKKREQEEKERVRVSFFVGVEGHILTINVIETQAVFQVIKLSFVLQALQAELEAARLLKQKEEEEAKQVAQQVKKEKEIQKKAIKKERQKLRTTCKVWSRPYALWALVWGGCVFIAPLSTELELFCW